MTAMHRIFTSPVANVYPFNLAKPGTEILFALVTVGRIHRGPTRGTFTA